MIRGTTTHYGTGYKRPAQTPKRNESVRRIRFIYKGIQKVNDSLYNAFKQEGTNRTLLYNMQEFGGVFLRLQHAYVVEVPADTVPDFIQSDILVKSIKKHNK